MLSPIAYLPVALLGLLPLMGQQSAQVALKDVKAVSAAVQNGAYKPIGIFSMGGLVFDHGLKVSGKEDARPTSVFVYRPPTGAGSFRGAIGFDDADLMSGVTSEVSIAIDGTDVKSFSVSPNQKPLPFDIEVPAGKSVRITSSGPFCLGNPHFVIGAASPAEKPRTQGNEAGAKPQESGAKPAELARVKVTSPASGEVVKNSVSVEWEAIPGAVLYSVEVVLISANDSKRVITKPRRAYSTKGDRFDWLITEDMVNGDYQVSVIAFGKRGVISKFSSPVRIRVQR